MPEAKESDNGRPATNSDVPSALAEAEEEVSRAEARAEAARARAMLLRRQAEAGSSDPSDLTADADDADGDVGEIEPAPPGARHWRPRWVRRPSRKAVAGVVGILLVCASLAASGYMVWQDHTIMHKRRLTPEFAAAARHGVTVLMTIDPKHAKEDIQRIIDASTGDLKTQIEARSALMAQQAEDTKVTSKGTVEAVGVESVTDKSGVVLVSAKSDVTNADNTKRPPMMWRVSVQIERDGGQLKMSRVDFL